MRVALYARVSTSRQAQAQTIDQQLICLRTYAAQQGWVLDDQHIYRDDGVSGASLNRPGLDQLRDQIRLAAFDAVLITAPDRFARNYVHQVLLIEEFERSGCQVLFVERPMSHDPHDQLLLQIRGAVAEYERSLISDRMRRGRLSKLRAGHLLPWPRPLYGYQVDPEHPRDPSGLHLDPVTSAIVQQIFAWYLEPQATLYQVAKRLIDAQMPTPTGKARWSAATVRTLLRNPAYTGTTYGNCTRQVAAYQRKSSMAALGSGKSHVRRPVEDWIAISIPALIPQDVFDQVQAKLVQNQQGSPRNNTHYDYLLRGLVSCGCCQLSATARSTPKGQQYYLCRGRTNALRAEAAQRCTARYTPAQQLDAVVWADLCAMLTDPPQIRAALERAQGGAWLPQELQARRTGLQQAISQLTRQQERLLDAYLAATIDLAIFERKHHDLAQRTSSVQSQLQELEALAQQRIELRAVASSVEAFCAQVRTGLANATFAQRRALVELLIDRVVVTNDEVEIHYVIPTSPAGARTRFCHLRKNYFQQIRGTHQRMQAGVEVIKGKATGDIQAELAHHLWFKSAPLRLKLGEAHLRLRARRRLEDRVCVATEVLPPQPTTLLRSQPLLAGRIDPQRLAIAKGTREPTHFMHHTALLLCGRQFGSQRRGQPGTAIADHQAHRIGIEPTALECRQDRRPRLGTLRLRRFVVQDLVASILPHAHHGQDYTFLAAHFHALVIAAVEKGLAGWRQGLHPHAIDDQNGRGVGDRALSPALQGRLGRQRHAIDRIAREHMPKQDIHGFLEVADGESQGIQVERLVEHDRHGDLVARQDVPGPLAIARAQLGDAQIGNVAVGGQHAAGVGACALEGV
jgi:site-specific DNA recombinase